MTPAPSHVVLAEGLGRAFRGRTVLSGADFHVAPGEIFGVLGPDGAGKTTLLQMLAAILDPTSGRSRVLGYDSVREAREITRRIGYMAQGFTLYDHLTVDENLLFAARIRGVRGEVYRARRARLLDMAGLGPFGGRRAGALSGGMAKKLSLCTNLIHEPPLLVLDELSLGVDPLSRRELWTMLRNRRERGVAIVVSTPYMDEAVHCDRLAVLHGGRVLAVDSPQALTERGRGTVLEVATPRPEAAEAALGDRAGIAGVRSMPDRLRVQVRLEGDAAGLERALAAFGSVGRVRPVLEEAFVSLTGGDSGPVLPGDVPAPAIAPAAGEPAVDVCSATCRFGDFVAVDRVSLRVSPGEVFGFLGPNGAGKTTLIRALCGLLAPSSGELRVAGVDVRREPAALRSRIGYMSQRFSLYPDLTVAENLAFFAGAYGLRGHRRARAIGQAVEITGLGGLEHEGASELSGAVRQRLALACALLHRPAVLFLDEPTSGVDPAARGRFWSLIRRLASGGATVFVTTHYLEEAAYCQRLGLMHAGRLVASGSLEELARPVGLTVGDIEEIFMAHIERARSAEQAA